MPGSLYGYVWQVSRRDQVWLCLLSILVSVLTMVPLEIQRRVVNSVLEQGTFRTLAMLCAAYALVAVFQGALKFMMNYCRGRAGEDAMRHLRRRIYCETVYEHGEAGGRKGSVVSMVSAEVEPLGDFVGESVSVPLVELGILLSVFGYMFWVEPWMALVSLGILFPQVLFIPPMQRRINQRSKVRTEVLRDLGEGIVEDAEREPRGGQDDLYVERIDRVYGLRLQTFRWKFAMKFLINFSSHIGTVSMLFVGGWFVLEGRTEIGTVVAFLSSMERVSDPWRELVGFFRRLSDARVKYHLVSEALTA